MNKGLFTGINATVLTQEKMSLHTTFKIGGPADYFVVPKDIEALQNARVAAIQAGLKYFILGGGANVLFSDEGYDGAVISTEGLNQIFLETNGLLHAGCGAAISDVAKFASMAGRAGLQFFYSMPGSTGGAIYMNARCYNASISDALKASKRVHVDGFGTFKIGISSRGADSVEDFNASENIRGCRVLFQPEITTDPSTHKRLKKLIQGMTFQSSASLVSAKEMEERGKDEGVNP